MTRKSWEGRRCNQSVLIRPGLAGPQGCSMQQHLGWATGQGRRTGYVSRRPGPWKLKRSSVVPGVPGVLGSPGLSWALAASAPTVYIRLAVLTLLVQYPTGPIAHLSRGKDESPRRLAPRWARTNERCEGGRNMGRRRGCPGEEGLCHSGSYQAYHRRMSINASRPPVTVMIVPKVELGNNTLDSLEQIPFVSSLNPQTEAPGKRRRSCVPHRDYHRPWPSWAWSPARPWLHALTQSSWRPAPS